jgi:hypothetical protein
MSIERKLRKKEPSKPKNTYPPKQTHYYHGTTLKVAQQILKEGVKATDIDLPDCNYGIFVSDSEDGAGWWALQCMYEEQLYDDIPAVIAIEMLPTDEMTYDPFPLWKKAEAEIICSKHIPGKRVTIVYPSTPEETEQARKDWLFFDTDKYIESIAETGGDFDQEVKENLQHTLGKYYEEYIADRMVEFEL